MAKAGGVLTAVVPLRLTTAPREPLRRLARLLSTLPPGIEVVVADDTEDPSLRALVAAVVVRRDRAMHADGRRRIGGAPFSIGHLRDVGTAAAATPYVMFHDVDFVAPRAFYRRLAAGLAAGKVAPTPDAFRCVPVWFLTRAGSAAWRQAPAAVWQFLRWGGRPARALSLRLTLGSSAILARRATLIEAGGHSTAFSGHGAEDFELMHRLSARAPIGPRPPDYAVDFGSRDTGERGFRAYFARYARPLLAEGLVMAHLWHPPRHEDPRYYAARAANFERLRRALDTDDGRPPELRP